MRSNHLKVAALFVLPFTCGNAGRPALAQGMPSVGNVQMPLVSPEQAAQFFATRVVPPSSVPALAPAAASAQPPQSVNVEPILGHDLPTTASEGGFPRADFAIAKPDDGKKKSPAVSAAVVASRPPSATIIQEQPPVIGKP